MLHGLDFLLPLTFISINYFITKAIRHLPESTANALIWAYNGAVREIEQEERPKNTGKLTDFLFSS